MRVEPGNHVVKILENPNDVKWHLQENVPGSQVNVGNRTKHSALFIVTVGGEKYHATVTAIYSGHSIEIEHISIKAHPNWGYEPDRERISATMRLINNLLNEFIGTH